MTDETKKPSEISKANERVPDAAFKVRRDQLSGPTHAQGSHQPEKLERSPAKAPKPKPKG